MEAQDDFYWMKLFSISAIVFLFSLALGFFLQGPSQA
jgi:hypothetical protein